MVEGDHRVLGEDAGEKKLAELVRRRLDRHSDIHTFNLTIRVAPAGQENRPRGY